MCILYTVCTAQCTQTVPALNNMIIRRAGSAIIAIFVTTCIQFWVWRLALRNKKQADHTQNGSMCMLSSG